MDISPSMTSLNISEDYTCIICGEKWFSFSSDSFTWCTLMEGNMFWNMVAISLMCMPTVPKLFSTSKGWWVNCWSCILCLFNDETTSLISVYWKKKICIRSDELSWSEFSHMVKERADKHISAFTLKLLHSTVIILKCHHLCLNAFILKGIKEKIEMV